MSGVGLHCGIERVLVENCGEGLTVIALGCNGELVGVGIIGSLDGVVTVGKCGCALLIIYGESRGYGEGGVGGDRSEACGLSFDCCLLYLDYAFECVSACGYVAEVYGKTGVCHIEVSGLCVVLCEGTVQDGLLVEAGGLCDGVYFKLKLIKFILKSFAVDFVFVRIVCRLYGQFAHTLQNLSSLVESALSGLYQRDSVLGVGVCLLKTTDMSTHLLADCKAGCVVGCGVDGVTGRELFDCFCDVVVVLGVLGVGVHRGKVSVDTHNIFPP